MDSMRLTRMPNYRIIQRRKINLCHICNMIPMPGTVTVAPVGLTQLVQFISSYKTAVLFFDNHFHDNIISWLYYTVSLQVLMFLYNFCHECTELEWRSCACTRISAACKYTLMTLNFNIRFLTMLSMTNVGSVLWNWAYSTTYVVSHVQQESNLFQWV